MKTLGAALIVKNEELVIRRCIESIIPVCDEIVVVDTGSSDGTLSILDELRQVHPQIKVFNLTWVDDFSIARNYSFGLVTTDYVMWVDADEEFKEPLNHRIIDLKNNDFDGYDIISTNILFMYADQTFSSCTRERIIFKSINPYWRFPVHEQLVVKGRKTHIDGQDCYVFHDKKKESNSRYYYEIYLNQSLHGQVEYSFHNIYYFLWMASVYDKELARVLLAILMEVPIDEGEYDYRLWFKDCGLLSPDEWNAFMLITTCDPTEPNLRLLLNKAIDLYREEKWYAAFLLLSFCQHKLPSDSVLYEESYEYVIYTACQLNLLEPALISNNDFYQLFPNNEIAIQNNKYFSSLNKQTIIGIIYFNGNQWRLPNLLFHMQDLCTNIIIASDDGTVVPILSGIEYPVTYCKLDVIDEVLSELNYDGLMVIDDSSEITFKEKCELIKSHKYAQSFIELETDSYKLIKNLK